MSASDIIETPILNEIGEEEDLSKMSASNIYESQILYGIGDEEDLYKTSASNLNESPILNRIGDEEDLSSSSLSIMSNANSDDNYRPRLLPSFSGENLPGICFKSICCLAMAYIVTPDVRFSICKRFLSAFVSNDLEQLRSDFESLKADYIELKQNSQIDMEINPITRQIITTSTSISYTLWGMLLVIIVCSILAIKCMSTINNWKNIEYDAKILRIENAIDSLNQRELELEDDLQHIQRNININHSLNSTTLSEVQTKQLHINVSIAESIQELDREIKQLKIDQTDQQHSVKEVVERLNELRRRPADNKVIGNPQFSTNPLKSSSTWPYVVSTTGIHTSPILKTNTGAFDLGTKEGVKEWHKVVKKGMEENDGNKHSGGTSGIENLKMPLDKGKAKVGIANNVGSGSGGIIKRYSSNDIFHPNRANKPLFQNRYVVRSYGMNTPNHFDLYKRLQNENQNENQDGNQNENQNLSENQLLTPLPQDKKKPKVTFVESTIYVEKDRTENVSKFRPGKASSSASASASTSTSTSTSTKVPTTTPVSAPISTPISPPVSTPSTPTLTLTSTTKHFILIGPNQTPYSMSEIKQKVLHGERKKQRRLFVSGGGGWFSTKKARELIDDLESKDNQSTKLA